MKSLILGAGEIGTALHTVLVQKYVTYLEDENPTIRDGIEILHICFPWTKRFEDWVRTYRSQYHPQIVVVHSTVPVGTCRRLGVIHSPVVGQHSDLEKSLKVFTKFIGGIGPEVDVVAEYFLRVGLKVYICRQPETTELAKLLSTTYYGLLVEYAKEAECLCRDDGVPFAEAYTLFQEASNEGFREMGRPDLVRPVLVPIQQTINGHCVLPNAELFPESRFAKLILELNGE